LGGGGRTLTHPPQGHVKKPREGRVVNLLGKLPEWQESASRKTSKSEKYSQFWVLLIKGGGVKRVERVTIAGAWKAHFPECGIRIGEGYLIVVFPKILAVQNGGSRVPKTGGKKNLSIVRGNCQKRITKVEIGKACVRNLHHAIDEVLWIT